MNREAAPCGRCRIFKAAVFIVVVALMVALAVMVAWP